MYPPQKLRYQKGDNIDSANLETPNAFHSPILGYAYDGNPIYGPYGYDRKDGGGVRVMRSGYSLKTTRENGPPISIFPLGFFVEDYEYLGDGDLNENNGRYCICLLYTSPSPRDRTRSRMPSSA